MEVDLTPIIVSIVAIVGVIMTSKVFLNHKGSGSKVLRSKIAEHEDYEKYLKKMNTVYKNKANSMERPPMVEGEMGELTDLIPELVGAFGDNVPKWAQGLLKDKEMLNFVMTQVKQNPDKAKEWFGKIVGKKNDSGQGQTDPDVLSV
jgi:hypothetical protein